MYQDPAGNRYANHEYYEGTNIRKFKMKLITNPQIEIETVDRAIRYLLRKYDGEESKKEALLSLAREINWQDMLHYVKGEWRLDNYQFEDDD